VKVHFQGSNEKENFHLLQKNTAPKCKIIGTPKEEKSNG